MQWCQLCWKSSTNNSYSVRRTGSNTTQIPLRMTLRPFTPTKPILDVQTTSQDCKFVPEQSSIMTCTPGQGSMKLKSPFSSVIQTNRVYLIPVKQWQNLKRRMPKRVAHQEIIWESSQGFSTKQADYMTERRRITSWALMCKRLQNNRTSTLVIHAVQNKDICHNPKPNCNDD